jgi:hypothetical protein
MNHKIAESPGHNLFLDGWARWDASWYRDIAENGYSDQPRTSQQLNVVFFPLYPLSIRMFNLVTHNSVLSGILISNLAYGVTVLLLFQLACDQYSERVAKWEIVILSIYPFSFYFSAMYSESVFLLMVVTAFYFAHHERWREAALCAALASAVRSVGLLVSLGLALEYLEQANFRWEEIHLDILWLLLCPLGLAAYIGFLWYSFGDPLIFIKARYVPGWEQDAQLLNAWRAFRSVLSIPALGGGHYAALDFLHISISLLGLGLLISAWSKLTLSHAVWAIVTLLVSFVNGWHGMGRYILPIFPLFLAMPLIVKNEKLLLIISYISILFLSLFTVMYSHFYWVS